MACERGDDAERYKLMFFLFLANKRWPFWNRHTHFFTFKQNMHWLKILSCLNF